MSDRDALLAAIRAQPDEDTPRLVFADWCDENDEPQRAAFIRAQVEYHRLLSADTPAAATDEFLDEVDAHLDQIDWNAVDANLGACRAARQAMAKRSFKLTMKSEGVPKDTHARFDSTGRGFYDTVSGDADILRHADAIFASAPITNVQFWRIGRDDATKFVAAGNGGYELALRRTENGAKRTEAVRHG